MVETCPRAFEYLFDGREYILSQFDEEQHLKDDEKINLNRNELFDHPEYGPKMTEKEEILRLREQNGYIFSKSKYYSDTESESDDASEPEKGDDKDTSYSECKFMNVLMNFFMNFFNELF